MRTIDARGMRCPWPAIRLGRALREGGATVIEMLADDPNAERELAALSAGRGLSFETIEPGRFRIGEAR